MAGWVITGFFGSFVGMIIAIQTRGSVKKYFENVKFFFIEPLAWLVLMFAIFSFVGMIIAGLSYEVYDFETSHLLRTDVVRTENLYSMTDGTYNHIEGEGSFGLVSGHIYLDSQPDNMYKYKTDMGEGYTYKIYTGVIEIVERDSEKPRIMFRENVYENAPIWGWYIGEKTFTRTVVPKMYIPVGSSANSFSVGNIN